MSLPWLPAPGSRATGPVAVLSPDGSSESDLVDLVLVAWAVLLYHHTGDRTPVIGLRRGAVGLRVTPDAPVGTAVERVETDERALPLRVVLGVDAVPAGELVVAVHGTELLLHHDPALHDADAVARHARHLGRVLSVLAERPDTPVRSVDPLTPEEHARVVLEWNDTGRDYPADRRVEQLFAARVAAAPDRLAVVHGDTALTYAELDRRAGLLAAWLRTEGLRRAEPVALLLAREPTLVVAALAVLKAGGAYLPIDPEYPAERVEYLLADSGARRVLTAAGLDEFDWTGEPSFAAASSGPDDPAYLMYTSGTTGDPKGVLVPHRGVVRLVSGADHVRFDETTRTAQIGATGFDASVWEMWGTLLGGGCLHLLDRETVVDAVELKRELAARRITTALFTSALFNQLADEDPELFRPLRDLLVGGDVLGARQARAVLRANPDLRLVNAYGPTENAVISTCHVVTEPVGDSVPIGRPVRNTVARVLNHDRLPLPVGVPGELHVGGVGIASGYLGRPELTERAFVPDPFREGEFLYRTGDRVRLLPGGEIDFVGRTDHQVKVRGFRVEPGEVETALLRNPAIRAAVVLARRRPESSDAYLCAYVATGQAPEAVREAVRPLLPPHLVPSYVVVLHALPLTANGKVDRGALPDPGVEPGIPGDAPSDDVERALVELWEDVLGVRGVGVRDSLDRLGASSLTATRLAARVRSRFGVACPVSVVLAAPTVAGVAAHVRSAAGTGVVGPRPGTATDRTPLSPQQRRIYVEQVKDPEGTQYNQPVVLDVPGTDDVLRAFATLVARHEILRTDVVVDDDGFAWQRVHDELPVEWSTGWVTPFDPHRAPLWRLSTSGTRVRLDFHHLITDGVSLTSLMTEWAALLRGDDPAPVGLRYRDYAHWAAGSEGRRLAAGQRDFWTGVLTPPPRPVDLPTDAPRPPVRRTEGAHLVFPLGAERSRAVRELARAEGRTPFHVLLAGYAAFLARITGSDDVTVGTPVSGRHLPGVEHVQGMFVNTLCLRLRPAGGLSFRAHLRDTAEHAIAAADHQDHPFEELAQEFGARDHARHPLFDTLFAVQDTGLHQVDFPGGAPRWTPEATGRTIVDLELQVDDAPEGFTARWGYSTTLFRRPTVELFRDELLALLDAVLADPGVPLEGHDRRPVGAVDLPDLDFDF
ncbi:amino acid adenylation domain-containing protein [Umezawaea sp. Da 62-37]|uniref:amino acid adenylation domain-containing protein n=1 Tax=Umezawaea sp. Da 62-37 TaxID=3075927 RepID=UPI0028F70D14|nr:amino acid adenylation domain-containing protein [Umezawaea sp. Da 62-37]WNV87781.1 amino acid adenylation domain-containing protein [Umezawaea sp. Da 62-37]